MQDSKKSGVPGCLKFGCLGCLTLIAGSVGLLLMLGAMQVAFQPSEAEMEKTEYSHPLPESVAGLLKESPEAREVLPLPDSVNPDVQPGRLELDLSLGTFIIKPGPAGQPIKVEAEFDGKSFKLEEEFTISEEGTWSYAIDFGSRHGVFSMLFSKESNNRVVITIPRDQPFEIVGEIGVGESEFDLSGLWIREVDLEVGVGEHEFVFREPSPFPMERFKLESSVGELTVRQLGNASPRTVQVSHHIGEFSLDLRGAWQEDAEVDVSLNIGEFDLRLPHNMRVKLEGGRVVIGDRRVDLRDEEDLPEDAPTMTLRAQGKIGEIKIR
jgi:hypothetical protein